MTYFCFGTNAANKSNVDPCVSVKIENKYEAGNEFKCLVFEQGVIYMCISVYI